MIHSLVDFPRFSTLAYRNAGHVWSCRSCVWSHPYSPSTTSSIILDASGIRTNCGPRLQSPSYPRHACLIASSPHSHTSTGAHLNTFSLSTAIDCKNYQISTPYLARASPASLKYNTPFLHKHLSPQITQTRVSTSQTNPRDVTVRIPRAQLQNS